MFVHRTSSSAPASSSARASRGEPHARLVPASSRCSTSISAKSTDRSRQSAECRPPSRCGDELVDEPVVLDRRLPAHAAEQADALHRPTAGNTGWTAGGATRTRASTTGAPSGPTMTGLRSSSAIAGCASASAPTRTAMSASASTSARARSSSARERRPSDHVVSLLERERGEPDRDVLEHLGASRRPRRTRRPARSARPPARRRASRRPPPTIRCTRKPSTGVPAASSCCAISCAARRTAVGPVRPSRTAPACALWMTPGAMPFSATGPPSSAAAFAAAATELTRRCSTSAIP